MLFSVQISEDENYEVLTPQSMREKIRLNKERAHARMLSAIHAHRAHDDDLEAELQNHSQVISQVWGHAGKLEVSNQVLKNSVELEKTLRALAEKKLEDKVGWLEKIMGEKDDKLEDLQLAAVNDKGEMEALRVQLATAETKMGEKDDKLEDLQLAAVNDKGEMEALRVQLATAETKSKEIERKLATVEKRYEGEKEVSRKIKEKLVEKEARVEDLVKKLKHAEQEGDKLENLIEKHRDIHRREQMVMDIKAGDSLCEKNMEISKLKKKCDELEDRALAAENEKVVISIEIGAQRAQVSEVKREAATQTRFEDAGMGVEEFTINEIDARRTLHELGESRKNLNPIMDMMSREGGEKKVEEAMEEKVEPRRSSGSGSTEAVGQSLSPAVLQVGQNWPMVVI